MAIKINNPRYGNIFFQGETFEELRSILPTTIQDGFSAIVRGQSTAADGYGGLFAWKPTSTTPDNDQTVIAPSAGGVGRWVAVAVGRTGPQGQSITGPIGQTGPIGPTGGNVMSVGLFAVLKTTSIPVGADLVQTSGQKQRGTGAARYSVGPVGAPAEAETPYSTNTANGRPVRLIEPVITVDHFGAVPDGVTDCYPAFSAAITYAASLGGAEILVPAVGVYMISDALEMRGKVTLRGASGIQGGPGTILCKGVAFLRTPTAYPLFTLRGISAQAGTDQVTDFLNRAQGGGVWSYGTCEDCYFVNFRQFNAVVLGVKFLNNNFQNLGSAQIGGADMLWIGNYANLSLNNTAGLEYFWQFQATGATDFSHNYFTCLKNATNDPIVLDVNLTDRSRFNFNQLDGGTVCSLRVSSASHSVTFMNNRFASMASWAGQGHVPILLNENIADCNIRDCWAQGILPNDPFFATNGQMIRVIIADNIATNDRTDNTTHDITGSISDGSTISYTGASVPKTAAGGNGARFYSLHMQRTLTNSSAKDTSNPRINYFDSTVVKAGMVINCMRVDPTRRWIIYDQVANTSIYDSDRDTSAPYFRLQALTDGKLTLDIKTPPATGGTTP